MELDKTFPTFKKIFKNTLNGYYPKKVFKYCLRIMLFLFLHRIFCIDIATRIATFQFLEIFIQKERESFSDIAFLFLFVYIGIFYLISKISGIFKPLKNINLFLAFIIIICIDILLNFSDTLTIQLFPLKLKQYGSIDYSFYTCFCFVLYKFFNFLTKKFPTPFEQIGYIFSFECYKNLFLKIRTKLKK